MAAQFSISPNTRSAFNDAGGLLLNVNTGAVYCLSTVGAQVWSLLEEHEQGLTFDAILRALMRTGDVPSQRLLVQLKVFLMHLETRGLVRESEASESNSYAAN